MGFGYKSRENARKDAPKKTSFFGMISIMVIIAVSVVAGYLIPQYLDVRDYLPFLWSWNPLAISFVEGLAVFIALQFFYVLIAGILFPLPPKDQYDQDGMYIRKKNR